MNEMVAKIMKSRWEMFLCWSLFVWLKPCPSVGAGRASEHGTGGVSENARKLAGAIRELTSRPNLTVTKRVSGNAVVIANARNQTFSVHFLRRHR